MENIEVKGIEKAIELALKCKPEDGRPHPKVGAVIIQNNLIVCEAYRGEENPGDHAEYTALIKKCRDRDLRGATLIATLEPCTSRKHDKKPCSQHIVDKGIKKVIIGMVDPNPEIRGKGLLFLGLKNIQYELFPQKYKEKIIDINKDFFNAQMGKYTFDLMRDDLLKELPVSTEPIDFQIFKNVYDFATSYTDMNLSKMEAKEFATHWIEQPYKNDFQIFKSVYDFSTSYINMNLSKMEAKEFASYWMEQPYKNDFQNFKKVYNNATSYTGMNLSKMEAKKFAIDWMKRSEPVFHTFITR